MTIKHICIYHGVDLDGYCSAAIWWEATTALGLENRVLLPLNYGWEVPWEALAGNSVVLLDFCLQPWVNMEKLYTISHSLTWIDHHSSAIKESGVNLMGLRDVNYAACELTWKYYYPHSHLPLGVFLLGDYDCWRHSDANTLPYQMGMRYEGMSDPRDERWRLVFDEDTEFNQRVLTYGQVIHDWENRQNARLIKSGWFPCHFANLRWMAINRGMVNSKLWDSVWDDSYDGMLAFHYSSKGYWTISLYSTTVDCGALASEHGGGGHAGAAGFQYYGADIFNLIERVSDVA